MYSMMVLAAMAGGVAGPGNYYFHADPCPCCYWPVFPAGGIVVFYWAGPAGLSDVEEKEWQEYLDALDSESDKGDAKYYWSAADQKGKRMLLAQVRAMRAKKDEEAKKKEEDMKKDEKGKDADKKDPDKKGDDKKIPEKKVEEKKDDK